MNFNLADSRIGNQAICDIRIFDDGNVVKLRIHAESLITTDDIKAVYSGFSDNDKFDILQSRDMWIVYTSSIDKFTIEISGHPYASPKFNTFNETLEVAILRYIELTTRLVEQNGDDNYVQ